MTLAKVVYASMTGNTESAANVVTEALQEAGIEVEQNECQEVSAADFKDADICIIATYTWGDGELPDEIIDFYDELQTLDLSGKVYGVVGTGDTSYDLYCKSADDFEEAFEKTGAKKGAECVKIENEGEDEDVENLKAFATKVVAAL